MVLVELADSVDPDSGQRYTVKRYSSDKTEHEETWSHASITLSPVNKAFDVITLTAESQVRIIAEFVAIL